ncbi:unnamed protein product [Cochlearia groenlandica]
MGTVVYQQGFQSSQLNEPIALRLRLSSPNPLFFQPFGLALKSHLLDSSNTEDTLNPNYDDDKQDSSSGGWSFLQSLSSSSSSLSYKTTSSEKELTTYVQKPSYCRGLSEESLALCTEKLGSETGSDVTTDLEELFSLSVRDVQSKKPNKTTIKTRKRDVVISPSDLPPPLTSMRGSHCIQMRPHREDGRLVMTATKAPPRNRCFQADRSNGRLRLSILRDFDEIVDNKEDDTIESNQENEEEDDDEVMGTENVHERSRRCVQGDLENRGLLNWESFCIATF